MTPVIGILVLVMLTMTGVYVSWRVGRLDRLRTRLEMARASLDAALVRRSSVTLELASCGLLDPATSLLLAGLAHDARSAPADRELADRELAESELTKALRMVFSQPGFGVSVPQARLFGTDELLAELEATAYQVFLARTFYNDAVLASVVARRRAFTRLLRLAGGAPMPEFFEIDDSLAPCGTGQPAGHADAGTAYDGNRRSPTTRSPTTTSTG